MPTAQHLAGSLGVNANTVRAVYRELEQDGYLVSEQGRGTFVAANSPSARDEFQRVHDLMDEVVVRARHMGISADDLARIAFLRARIFTPEESGVRVLFAECNRPEVEFHAKTIVEGTGIEPATFLLEQLRGKGSRFFDRFDVLATTLFHSEELQSIVGPDRRVLGLMVEPSFDEVLARLIPLPRGTRVAVICSTKMNARKIVNALLGTGLTHLKFWTVPLEDREEIERAFRKADQVFISRLVRTLHKGPWPTDRTIHEYIDVLDATALRLLRRGIAEMAAVRPEEGKRKESRTIGARL